MSVTAAERTQTHTPAERTASRTTCVHCGHTILRRPSDGAWFAKANGELPTTTCRAAARTQFHKPERSPVVVEQIEAARKLLADLDATTDYSGHEMARQAGLLTHRLRMLVTALDVEIAR